MKRWVVTCAAALLVLSLTACGGTAELDELRAENAALAAENQTLQEENRRLTQALEEQASRQTEEEAAADESGDASLEEHNPIDDFFDGGRYWDCGTTAAMRAVADAYSRAWEAELRALAERQKEALLYQEDRDLVDAFVRAVEEQADCMLDLNAFSLADLEAEPGEARLAAAGTLLGPVATQSRAEVYRSGYFQLLYACGYPGEEPFRFDPEAAGRELDEELGEEIVRVREAAEG